MLEFRRVILGCGQFVEVVAVAVVVLVGVVDDVAVNGIDNGSVVVVSLFFCPICLFSVALLFLCVCVGVYSLSLQRLLLTEKKTINVMSEFSSVMLDCGNISLSRTFVSRGKSRAAATSKIERFLIIVKLLTVITKRSIQDVTAALDPPHSVKDIHRKNLRAGNFKKEYQLSKVTRSKRQIL